MNLRGVGSTTNLKLERRFRGRRGHTGGYLEARGQRGAEAWRFLRGLALLLLDQLQLVDQLVRGKRAGDVQRRT